jgi:alpha-L-rhamnosidase
MMDESAGLRFRVTTPLHCVVILICLVLAGGYACLAQRMDAGSASVSAPRGLLFDGAVNPLGIDNPAPLFHWTLVARRSQLRDVKQTAFRIVVARSRAALDQDNGDAWDSGRTVGTPEPFARYAGNTFLPDTTYYWKVRVWTGKGSASAWSAPAKFTTGLLQPSNWQAKWIAGVADGPRLPQAQGDDESRVKSVPPLPIFRCGFNVSKPLARATLFISGLGESESFVNGRPITNALLTPGWSAYRKTVLYDTYDATPLLHQGSNVIGVLLGNGMYNVEGLKGRYTKFVGSTGQPKLIAELHLHYTDGTTATITSGDDWKTTDGPVRYSSIYGGEDYDARLAPPGWMQTEFDDQSWRPAVVVDGPGGALRSERLPPVVVVHRYKPVTIKQINDHVTLYDFGKNFAGTPEIEVHGPAGASVQILTGELLDASGRVTQQSAAATKEAPVLFNYTLRGKGVEHWSPKFTYYGFRYAEVTVAGDSGLPHIDAIQGQELHDAVTVDGRFSSSNEMLNRIHRLIDAAMLNNMVSVLTDCPTREKLGWLEQTHLAGTALMYNYDLSLLYRKLSLDIRDAQLSDGMVPSIAPEVVAFSGSFRDSPEWGSASVLSPWTAYTFYGGKQVLRENYHAMVAYVDYLRSRAKDNMLAYGLGDWYDVGPGEPGESKLTTLGLTATAIYYEDLQDLERIAKILDKPEEAAAFASRAADVKASFNQHLFHAGADSYDRGSQTANAMALALDLVPEGHRAGVLNSLIRDIRAHGNHVTAGDIGFHYLVRALSDGGRSDVMYTILMLSDSPSYGYQLKRGATALTEAWDAKPKSSQDHFMLGHAEEWFYRGLGGIDFNMSRESDRQIWIHPQVVGNIRSTSAEYDSVLGPIGSSWHLLGDELHVDISIPPGATATVSLPVGFRGDVRESGRSLKGDPGVLSVDEKSDSVSCVIGSGNYHFSARR